MTTTPQQERAFRPRLMSGTHMRGFVHFPLYSAEHWACVDAQKRNLPHKDLVPFMASAREKQALLDACLSSGFGDPVL